MSYGNSILFLDVVVCLTTFSPSAAPVKSGAVADSAPVADIEDCPAPCSLCLPADLWEPEKGVTNYPRKPRKAAPRAEQVAACVLHRDRRQFLLCQRPDSGEKRRFVPLLMPLLMPGCSATFLHVPVDW